MAEGLIRVEVVYASPERQRLLAVTVAPGTTASQAVALCAITDLFPEAQLLQCPMGIFGQRLDHPHAYVLQEGDRVEIYRPLVADPMEVRRIRAARNTKPSKKRG